MPATSWSRFSAELLALYSATRAPATTGKMRQVLREFGQLRGVRSTADLTPARVAAFLAACAARGRHPNTTATLLSYLRRAASYALGRGFLKASPFSAWSGWARGIDPEPPGCHSAAQLGRLLARLKARATTWEGHRLYALAATAAYTGLRRGELLQLRAASIDLRVGTIRVAEAPGRRLKRPTAARSVPIPPELAPILVGWLRRSRSTWAFPGRSGRGPWCQGAPGYRPLDALAAAGRAAGLYGLTFQSLRHSFATLAATDWGIAPAVLQRWMGHTDLKTTLRHYVHIDRAHLAAAAASVRLRSA